MKNPLHDFIKRFRPGHQDPARDWIVLMSVSVLASAVIIVWNAWAFDTVAGGGTLGAPVVRTTHVFTDDSLDVIHAVFNTRKQEQLKYSTGVYHFADPSQ